ncbi:MAG: PorT family protein [Bacteroidetes bacterium]|nr:PorT family protein [Bacteroidota bacterium]
MKSRTIQVSTLLQSLKNYRTVFVKGAGALALALSLLVMTASNAEAQQSLQIGVKAGGNFFKIGGRSFDGKVKPAISAGVYGELNFSSHWALQPELLFNQTIAKTSDQFNTIYGGASQQQVYLNYVALPVLVVFKPVPELSILVGPQYGFLAAQTTGLLQAREDQGKDAFNKNDLSIVFGGQLNLGKVKFGARYSAGLNNISFRTTDTWRQHGLQVYLGYQLKDLKLKKKK